MSFSLSLSSIKSFFSLLPYRLRWRHCHGPFLFGRLYSSKSLSSSLSLHHLCFLYFPYSIFYLVHLPSPFLSCLHLLVFIFSFFIFLFLLCFSIHRPPVALFLRPLNFFNLHIVFVSFFRFGDPGGDGQVRRESDAKALPTKCLVSVAICLVCFLLRLGKGPLSLPKSSLFPVEVFQKKYLHNGEKCF